MIDVHEVQEAAQRTLGITIRPEQAHAMIVHLQMVLQWNKTHNLTSIIDPQQMLEKHLLDSLALLPLLPDRPLSILDMGTGAGFPGIPLAIMREDCRWTLLDSSDKRVRFLRLVRHQCGIMHVDCVSSRVEQYTLDNAPDLILFRAFASLEQALSWSKHLAGPKTQWWAMKGQYPQEEIAAVEASQTYHVETQRLVLPQAWGERHLVRVFQKQS